MAPAPQPSPPLLTAEEFARRPDPGFPEELVRGRVVTMPPPGARHGKVCARVARLLDTLAEEHDLGHVFSNDAGVITGTGPDSVRGPDVSFYSFQKVPKESPLPEGYPDVPPDLVVEVLSPGDRWPNVLAKVAEYLNAGVAAVAVIDPDRRNVQVFEADQPVRLLNEADELTLPALLGDFRVAVTRLLG